MASLTTTCSYLLPLCSSAAASTPEPHWTAYLTAFATPMLAVLGIWIAYQQWVTARDKLRLDLYERRMKIYETYSLTLGHIFGKGDLTPEEERQYLVGTVAAQWLFDKDVQAYLEKEFWGKLIENHALVAELDGLSAGPEKTKLTERRAELRSWFNAQSERSDSLFMPYLGFHHKRPLPKNPLKLRQK